MSVSAIYTGEVWHSRRTPRRRDFRYPVYMFYLDLSELELPSSARGLFGGSRLFSSRRPAPARFRREDFLGDPARPLSACVRDLVERRTGERPLGPVRLLANARSFGYQFNPIAVYYVFDESEHLTHVVTDVTNIPWGESEAYVFAAESDRVNGLARKRMHVSPFLDMDYVYEISTSAPDQSLGLRVSNTRDGDVEFAAGLKLQLAGSSAGVLSRTLARFPAMAALVTARIFWQALKLRLGGHRWHKHPPHIEEPVDPVETEEKVRERVPIGG